MEVVVFLRGANAIGARVFSPAAVARDLTDMDVTSIGAAGTFIVRSAGSAPATIARFRSALPHDADIMVRTPAEIRGLLQSGRPAAQDGARVFVSVLGSQPAITLRLPIERGTPWMVRVVEVRGTFAIGSKRGVGGRWLDSNAVVESAFGVRATSRVWETFERIGRSLG